MADAVAEDLGSAESKQREESAAEATEDPPSVPVSEVQIGHQSGHGADRHHHGKKGKHEVHIIEDTDAKKDESSSSKPAFAEKEDETEEMPPEGFAEKKKKSKF